VTAGFFEAHSQPKHALWPQMVISLTGFPLMLMLVIYLNVDLVVFADTFKYRLNIKYKHIHDFQFK